MQQIVRIACPAAQIARLIMSLDFYLGVIIVLPELGNFSSVGINSPDKFIRCNFYLHFSSNMRLWGDRTIPINTRARFAPRVAMDSWDSGQGAALLTEGGVILVPKWFGFLMARVLS